jgi:SAM-dependent methyltransferase
LSELISSPFETWLEALEARHLADLTFSEVSRALRALSSAYVERRARLSAGAALSGAGKRAAFALFYGPLHYLLVQHIVAALGAASARTSAIVDLGCGTGAAGAACAGSSSAHLVGIDRHPWALAEAEWTYALFGLKARTRRGDIAAVEWPAAGEPATFVAAFTLNELADAERDAVMQRLLARSRRGDSVLVVEPLAGSVAPWWNRWRDEFERAGGRGGEWRFRIQLPAIVSKLDRAAGLNHRELTGRSLWRGSG